MTRKYAKHYLCIGGPLDGKMVTSNEFQPADKVYTGRSDDGMTATYREEPAGVYDDLREQYNAYSRGVRHGQSEIPKMVWLHDSLVLR